MKYGLIYADPPWTYRDKRWANGGACNHYPTMTVYQLMALNIGEIAARDCLLALWWVSPMPEEALRVAHAWGFTVKTMKGFTWAKVSKHGKEHLGMGNWTRANSEDCMFATRGSPKRVDAGVRQLVHARVGRHSEKPAEVRDRLVRLMGDVPRIELFARAETPGWDVWGNDVQSSIELPS